jgi:hypothetical protein
MTLTVISVRFNSNKGMIMKGRTGLSTAYLKWLIDWRTASSNSIGPGISKVGCSGWLDILDFSELWELELNRRGCGVGGSILDARSVENGVLIGSGGRGSRCLDMRESRA